MRGDGFRGSRNSRTRTLALPTMLRPQPRQEPENATTCDYPASVPHLFLTAQFTNYILRRHVPCIATVPAQPYRDALPSSVLPAHPHTLCSLLPPAARRHPRGNACPNDAAIAQVAALLPVNADEADIAAHCVAARAQAEDVMRSLRNHASDIHLSMKLNAQYCLMERTAVSVRTQLLRVQTARHKREKDPTACDQDGWSEHIAEQLMTKALGDAPSRPVAAPAPGFAPLAALQSEPIAALSPAEPVAAPAIEFAPIAAPQSEPVAAPAAVPI